MGYIIFEQCCRSAQQTQEPLQRLRQRHAVTEEMVSQIHLRRRTAALAMQATFEELCHAFITPFDREDLLLLRQCAENVTCAAEDVLLALHRHRLAALPESAPLNVVAVIVFVEGFSVTPAANRASAVSVAV